MAPSSCYPRYEDLDLEDANYRGDVRWSLFIDPSEAMPSKSVLIRMGEFWTVLDGPDFRRMAERLLRQL